MSHASAVSMVETIVVSKCRPNEPLVGRPAARNLREAHPTHAFCGPHCDSTARAGCAGCFMGPVSLSRLGADSQGRAPDERVIDETSRTRAKVGRTRTICGRIRNKCGHANNTLRSRPSVTKRTSWARGGAARQCRAPLLRKHMVGGGSGMADDRRRCNGGPPVRPEPKFLWKNMAMNTHEHMRAHTTPTAPINPRAGAAQRGAGSAQRAR